MRARLAILAFAAWAVLLGAGGGVVRAAPLVIDLSSDEVAITTGFAGTELLLFGAKEASGGDVIMVLRGPARDTLVRRKERVAGVWVTVESVVLRGAPAYYHVASTRPVEEIADAEILGRYQIAASGLSLEGTTNLPDGQAEPFRDGLIRNKQRQSLYGYAPRGVSVNADRLFRTNVTLPANVPTGPYRLDVFLFDEGQLIARQQSTLVVRKVGLEADIFNFAHQQGALHGLIAIAIAVAAGWLAGLAFRN